MANTLTGLILRLVKGTPLSPQEGDGNLTLIQNFVNSLAAQSGVSLNPDGTLKAGALNNLNQIANLATFSDAVNANGTLPAGVYGPGALPGVGSYRVSQPAITAPAAGVLLRFKADTLNAGATSLTLNAFPAANIYKNVTLALEAGDIQAGAVVYLIYDGTNWQMFFINQKASVTVNGLVLLAAAADVLAASSAVKAVTPVTMGAHPGVAKAWVKFTGATGAILASYNVSTVSRAAAGDYTINFITPFATGDYACSGMTQPAGGGLGQFGVLEVHISDTNLAASKRIRAYEPGVGSGDPTVVYFEAWGTQ